MTELDTKEKILLLRKSPLFRECSDEVLLPLVDKLEHHVLHRGDVVIHQGEMTTKIVLVQQGHVTRHREADGALHTIDTHLGGSSFGSLHVMKGEPSYSTAVCDSDKAEVFFLPGEFVRHQFHNDAQFSEEVLHSLTKEVRRHTKHLRTPLLQQHSRKTNFVVVAMAAAIESYYRAALNAFLNQALTGVKMDTLFPNMHIQMPIRVTYICGFKGLRQYLDRNVDPEATTSPERTRLLLACLPGMLMTPFSNVLEACNAGHANPEPLYKRCLRGTVPRLGREVIFGVGLNQLSDYCEERIPENVKNASVRASLGSLIAGVLCGYFSHVVHNMSTLKLMNPNKSYMQHLKDYIKGSESRLPSMPPSAKVVFAPLAAFIFPRGVLIRTTQIVGSFIILNGTIATLGRQA